jgi:hypothetical protein
VLQKAIATSGADLAAHEVRRQERARQWPLGPPGTDWAGMHASSRPRQSEPNLDLRQRRSPWD